MVLINVPVDTVDLKGHRRPSPYRKSFQVHAIDAPEGSGLPPFLSSTYECTSCGEMLKWKMVDNTPTIVNECSKDDDMTYSVKLSVPSGRIVFSDSLFDVMKDADQVECDDYNSAKDRKKYAQKLAEKGLIYGAVLNTCPDLFLNPATNSIMVANTEWDEETDKPTIPDGWQLIGGITTDLWAYSITDFDTWVAAGGSEDDPSVEFADVPAGVYTFTHYADQEGFDHHGAGLVVFAQAGFSELDAGKEGK